MGKYVGGWFGRMVRKFPMRGEIYWINLDPVIGSETKKTRPGLIISNDIGNEMSEVVIIAPITSKMKSFSCDIGFHEITNFRIESHRFSVQIFEMAVWKEIIKSFINSKGGNKGSIHR